MPQPLKIALLVCGGPSEGRERYDGDYAQMFERLFAEHAPEVALTNFDVRKQEYPSDTHAFDGFVSTGSACGVYESERWIQRFEAYVREFYSTGRRHVGVCFGHQMIARALGGAVELSERGWGVGVHETDVVSTKPWMLPPLRAYRLIVSHQDQVVRLPDGAELLATNQHCPISMFVMGDLAMGIQAHPEFRPVYARPTMLSRVERIGQAKVDAALATLDRPRHEAEITRWVRNFFAKD